MHSQPLGPNLRCGQLLGGGRNEDGVMVHFITVHTNVANVQAAASLCQSLVTGWQPTTDWYSQQEHPNTDIWDQHSASG